MTVRIGLVIAGGVLVAALVALVVTLALLLGGGDDGVGAGGEPAPALTEAPANMEECLEQQGLEDLDLSDPHGSASPADLQRFFQACGPFLHEGGGPPGGSPFGP